MNKLSKRIFDKYQIRKTDAQKDAFIKLLAEEFPELKEEKGGLLTKSRNLVLGDPDKADFLVTAHYDTCAKLPFPNLIFVNNALASYVYAFLVFGLIPMIVMIILEGLLLVNDAPLWLIALSLSAVYLGYFAFLLGGAPNKNTANDNTSGVLAVLELYVRLPKELKEKTCFVLFDNEENGLLGSRVFKRKHPEAARNAVLMNFDCVGDGDTMLMVYNKVFVTEKERLTKAFSKGGNKKPLVRSSLWTMYPSDQKGFVKGIGFAAMHHCFLGYYIPRIHTKRDTVLDENNLLYIRSGVERYMKAYLGRSEEEKAREEAVLRRFRGEDDAEAEEEEKINYED